MDRKAARCRENAIATGILAISGIVVLSLIGSCYRGIRFFDEAASKAMACQTADELRRSVPAEWLRERPFVKDGKPYLRISVYITPPKHILSPLAFKEPAFIFDGHGRKIDQCLREYDASEFRPRWRESYDGR